MPMTPMSEVDLDLARQVLVERPIGDLLDEHPYIENLFAAVRLEMSPAAQLWRCSTTTRRSISAITG